MVVLLSFAFCLLLSTEATSNELQVISYKTYNVSLNLEKFLNDPNWVLLGDPFPEGTRTQFQLEVNANDDEFGTYFGITSVEYGSPDWDEVAIDMIYDCSVEDDLGLWSQYLGRSYQKTKKVFISVGFTAENLKWVQLWDIKEKLPKGDNLNFKCTIDIASP